MVNTGLHLKFATKPRVYYATPQAKVLGLEDNESGGHNVFVHTGVKGAPGLLSISGEEFDKDMEYQGSDLDCKRLILQVKAYREQPFKPAGYFNQSFDGLENH